MRASDRVRGLRCRLVRRLVLVTTIQSTVIKPSLQLSAWALRLRQKPATSLPQALVHTNQSSQFPKKTWATSKSELANETTATKPKLSPAQVPIPLTPSLEAQPSVLVPLPETMAQAKKPKIRLRDQVTIKCRLISLTCLSTSCQTGPTTYVLSDYTVLAIL